MDRVRIGLVGCGLFGESHASAYRAVPQAEVAAVFDPVTERAKQLAATFSIPRVCSSMEELLHEPIDAVDIVSPENTHLEPALAALRAGKDIFVEKPMATDLGDCERIIQAAAGAGRILMPGHILRFEIKCALLKQEVETGRVGKIVSMYARRNRPRNNLEIYGRSHVVITNCVHDIDLMLWYTSARVVRVRGYARRATGRKHPDTFWGVLEFEGGALGVVETIWLLPAKGGVALDDALQVIGDRGVANLSLFPGGLTLWREDGFEALDTGYDPRVRGAALGALRDELMYFCDCVRRHRPPEIITPREAKNTVRVALALMESGERECDVEINEWD